MKRIFRFLTRFLVIPALVGGIFAGVFWALGLASFIVSILVMQPRPNLTQADGIVVLTGGSERVRTGLTLMEQKIAPRLLISGVHQKTQLKDLVTQSGMSGHTLPCCIDLGFRAPDTVGNAYETRDWARTHHIETIILITSNYHMPRALFEIKRVAPDVSIIPYPVRTEQFKIWTHTGAILALSEYHKTWISLLRWIHDYLIDNLHLGKPIENDPL